MKITRIQVFGERNSATNYIRKLMRDNYIKVPTIGGDRGFGWKHGDLGNPWCMYKDDGSKFCHNIRDYKKESDDVLFVVIYRNPFTWLQSMHMHPHHAPLHPRLPFNEFLRKKWKSYYGIPGQESSYDEKWRMEMVKDKNLFEEYDNVVDLRIKKTQVFEGFVKKVQNVVFVTYEHLKDDPENMIKTIAETYNLPIKKQLVQITEDKFGFGKYKPKTYPPINTSDLEYIIKHLNWRQEKKIGYEFDKDKWKNRPKDSFFMRLIGRSGQVEKPTDYITFNYKIRNWRNGRWADD